MTWNRHMNHRMSQVLKRKPDPHVLWHMTTGGGKTKGLPVMVTSLYLQTQSRLEPCVRLLTLLPGDWPDQYVSLLFTGQSLVTDRHTQKAKVSLRCTFTSLSQMLLKVSPVMQTPFQNSLVLPKPIPNLHPFSLQSTWKSASNLYNLAHPHLRLWTANPRRFKVKVSGRLKKWCLLCEFVYEKARDCSLH